jgi:lipopolysaccharide transport system permease protein
MLFWCVRSVEINRKLIRKIYFPRLILPIAAVIPALIEFSMYFLLAVLALAWYAVVDGTVYIIFGSQLLLALGGLALILTLGLGLGFILAVFGTQGRDTRFLLGYVTSFWFFLTPVIYPLSAVPASYERIALINPVTAPIELIRQGTIGAGSINPTAMVASVTTAVVAFAAGLTFFLRTEARAADSL